MKTVQKLFAVLCLLVILTTTTSLGITPVNAQTGSEIRKTALMNCNILSSQNDYLGSIQKGRTYLVQIVDSFNTIWYKTLVRKGGKTQPEWGWLQSHCFDPSPNPYPRQLIQTNLTTPTAIATSYELNCIAYTSDPFNPAENLCITQMEMPQAVIDTLSSLSPSKNIAFINASGALAYNEWVFNKNSADLINDIFTNWVEKPSLPIPSLLPFRHLQERTYRSPAAIGVLEPFVMVKPIAVLPPHLIRNNPSGFPALEVSFSNLVMQEGNVRPSKIIISQNMGEYRLITWEKIVNNPLLLSLAIASLDKLLKDLPDKSRTNPRWNFDPGNFPPGTVLVPALPPGLLLPPLLPTQAT